MLDNKTLAMSITVVASLEVVAPVTKPIAVLPFTLKTDVLPPMPPPLTPPSPQHVPLQLPLPLYPPLPPEPLPLIVPLSLTSCEFTDKEDDVEVGCYQKK